jgi:uncharacterized protein (DUF58 family)
VSRSGTPKLRAYAVVGALGVFGALVFGRPELVAAVAPMIVLLVMGFALSPDPRYAIGLSIDRRTVIEGQTITLRLDVHCVRPADGVELEAVIPRGIRIDGPHTDQIRPRAGEVDHIDIQARCARWGVYELGDVVVRAHDRFRLFRYEGRHRGTVSLKVYPDSERLRTLARPGRTLRLVGNLVSRELGDGIELAEVRPFRSGDRVRSMNWRASARRTGLWVTDRHPERNSDVVIFLDALTDLGSHEASSLDDSVRAAASLAEAHLSIRDRVGLVTFGGAIRWVTPGSGRRQYYRIVDALLDTKVSVSYAWRGIDKLPPRVLPARALVLALSPLVDERAVGALFDLRGRGIDLVVLEIPAERFVPAARTDSERVARRIWSLKRDVLRHRLERLGISVGTWREDASIEELLGEVHGFRRHAIAPRA